MQARRRRGDRPFLAGEDGLVADGIFGARLPLDVRRERHVAERPAQGGDRRFLAGGAARGELHAEDRAFRGEFEDFRR